MDIEEMDTRNIENDLVAVDGLAELLQGWLQCARRCLWLGVILGALQLHCSCGSAGQKVRALSLRPRAQMPASALMCARLRSLAPAWPTGR